jgi:hypothetical protein
MKKQSNKFSETSSASGMKTNSLSHEKLPDDKTLDAALIDSGTQIHEEKYQSKISDAQWELMVQSAIIRNPHHSGKFSWSVLSGFGITAVVSIVLTLFVVQNITKQNILLELQSIPIVAGHQKKLSGQLVGADSHLGIPSDNVVFTRVAESTGFLSDKGIMAKVYSQSDTSIILLLSRGSALFTIDSAFFRHMTILTPHAIVEINSGIARISVSEIESEVATCDGSVFLTSRTNQQTSVLQSGENGFIGDSYLLRSKFEDASVNMQRRSMLQHYLRWLGEESRHVVSSDAHERKKHDS